MSILRKILRIIAIIIMIIAIIYCLIALLLYVGVLGVGGAFEAGMALAWTGTVIPGLAMVSWWQFLAVGLLGMIAANLISHDGAQEVVDSVDGAASETVKQVTQIGTGVIGAVGSGVLAGTLSSPLLWVAAGLFGLYALSKLKRKKGKSHDLPERSHAADSARKSEGAAGDVDADVYAVRRDS